MYSFVSIFGFIWLQIQLGLTILKSEISTQGVNLGVDPVFWEKGVARVQMGVPS